MSTAKSKAQMTIVPLGIPGFHSCRRWRVSYLKTIGTPESLLKAWIGHSIGNDITARNDVSARYDKSANDMEWRQATANRVGIGFELPTLTAGDPPPRNTLKPRTQSKSAVRSKPTAPADVYTDIQPPYVANDTDLDEFFHSTPGLVPEEA